MHFPTTLKSLGFPFALISKCEHASAHVFVSEIASAFADPFTLHDRVEINM